MELFNGLKIFIYINKIIRKFIPLNKPNNTNNFIKKALSTLLFGNLTIN